jgi:hypothetical protein
VTAKIIGGITFDLADGPIRTKYGRGQYDGKQTAWLVLGEGRDAINISITGTPAHVLAELQEAVAELAAEAERQQRLAALPEVA